MVRKCLELDCNSDLLSKAAMWNDENVAFIKKAECDGKIMWSIYGADGVKIAMTDNRDFAFVVAKQNDLNPQSVH